MSKLFGVPVESLAAVLLVVLATALGAIGVLALRNRVFFRLGVRNVRRRPGRSALIVVGLMLGTTIITAALATGDTISHTIRAEALTSLGPTDEVVAAKGVSDELAVSASGSTDPRYFPIEYARTVARAGGGLLTGVAPVIVEPIAAQDTTTRQNEPRVTLFATDRALGEIKTLEGTVVSLRALRPGEVYLNAKGADALGARAGDSLVLMTGRGQAPVRVRAIVRYSGAGTSDSGVLMPLDQAQRMLGRQGLVRAVFVTNKDGLGATDRVIRRLAPALAPLGLETDNTKQDLLKEADKQGAMFMSLFTTFGSFSIAAGILLIFLIFVMLAAERRSELGIARAVGTRRRHLVQMFVYEGAAYDVLAAAVGTALGVVVAYGMVLAIAAAFGEEAGVTISYWVRPASVAVAYCIGVLLTFSVVAFSAWRVSRMNIVSAIRNLPDTPHPKRRRRRWIPGVIGVVLGVLLIASGARAKDNVTISLGVALAGLSSVPLLHLTGMSDRLAHTIVGLALLLWFTTPASRWIFGETKQNMGVFLIGGLVIVIASTWTIMYNAPALASRVRTSSPVLRMAMAYPLRNLFRTGVTLAMFTLVVFTLVVGATTSQSFVHAANNFETFSGGFDVTATVSPATPIANMAARLRQTAGLDVHEFGAVASISSLPVKARQVGVGGGAKSVLVHGADPTFFRNTTYQLAAHARGYGSSEAVWRAVDAQRGLAVVDPSMVVRKQNWGSPAADLQLEGFVLEDKVFDAVRLTIRDMQTGSATTLKVIGVLSDTAPQALTQGVWTSQSTLQRVFADRVMPTSYLFKLRPGIGARQEAKKLESVFVTNGMQADALQKILDDATAASMTFNRIVMGFMGLGLIVGVAALGVITARAVVERRQQIGVLRAIGFRRRMVQASFLIESAFIALTAIVVGTGLALVVSWNVVDGERRTPSWAGMAMTVPWLTLGIVFLSVLVVALLTTLAPAARASRIYPAEALRYQ